MRTKTSSKPYEAVVFAVLAVLVVSVMGLLINAGFHAQVLV
jgi:hypothetical protein